jgi:dihydropyrimidinase
MQADLVIRDCKIVTPEKILLGKGLVVQDGRIIDIAKEPDLPEAKRLIDAQGKFLLPGAVDPHIHFGFYKGFKDECRNGTKAAVMAGITSGIMMNILSAMLELESADQVPHPPTGEMFEQLKRNIEENSLIDLALRPWISNTTDTADIPYFVNLMGITSFKFLNHFIPEGMSHEITGFHGMDRGQLISAWEVVKDVGGIPCIHAEDPYIIRKYTNEVIRKVEQEGTRPTLTDWCNARPNIAEYVALRSDILLAQHVGCPIYFVHTSAKECLDYLRQCKQRDMEVYVEACPHHLVFTKHSRFKDDPTGAFGKTKVPLREVEDLEKLWQAINDGVIDCLGSDHVDTSKAAKLEVDMWGATWGFPAIETFLPVMFSEGVNKGRISINKLVEIAAENPARLFGLYPKKGRIAVGADADLVIVDLEKEMTVSHDLFPSVSDFNLYEGMTLRGWPIMTVVRGQVVMENGKITGQDGTGRYLRQNKYVGL